MKTIILLAMLTIGLSSVAQIKGMEAYKTVMLKGAIGEGVYPDYPYRVTTDIPNALINGDYIFPGKTLDEAVAEAVRILSVNGVPEMPYVIQKKVFRLSKTTHSIRLQRIFIDDYRLQHTRRSRNPSFSSRVMEATLSAIDLTPRL